MNENIIKWQNGTSLVFGNLNRDYKIENKTFSICITSDKCYFISPEGDYINRTPYTIIYENPLYLYKDKKEALSSFHKIAVKHIKKLFKNAKVTKEK
jgi:hypothetical protein